MKKNKKISNYLVNSASWTNGGNLLLPFVNSIGFRTNAIKYGQRDVFNKVAEDFLINSRCVRNDCESENSIQMYLEDAGLATLAFMGDEDIDKSQQTILPEGVPLNMELGESMVKRRSIRQYTGDTISLDYLATVLHAGAGITAEMNYRFNSSDEEVKLYSRSVPSGGGLYPVEIYIAVNNVERLSPGIYKYHSKTDSIIKLFDKMTLDLLFAANSIHQDFISLSRSNAVFLLVGHPWKVMRKYGNRGMRFMFQEAGGISQHINLAVAALGLGGVECASFYDDEVHKILKLDGLYRSFIHSIVVGVPA